MGDVVVVSGLTPALGCAAALKPITADCQAVGGALIWGCCAAQRGASPLTTTLNGLNASIASATLQQAHVVEDINQNVTQAAGLSHSTALAAEQSSVASAHLRGLSDQLDGLLRQFKV